MPGHFFCQSFTARNVNEALRPVTAERGIPDFICSDNGPEFIASAFSNRLTEFGTRTMFTLPEVQLENPYIEIQQQAEGRIAQR